MRGLDLSGCFFGDFAPAKMMHGADFLVKGTVLGMGFLQLTCESLWLKELGSYWLVDWMLVFLLP